MRFWRPESLAGGQSFYQHLETVWPFYYREWRWEYAHGLKLLKESDRFLEIGCGRGYFLKHAQAIASNGLGLETNQKAISEKVTDIEVRPLTVEAIAKCQPESFDKVFSFQVLEHVVDPASFLQSCIALLRRGGSLVVSTPDAENRALRRREDAFDLPPHHMGHFSEEVYAEIAKAFGLEVVKFYRSPLIPWDTYPLGQPSAFGWHTRLQFFAKNVAAKLLGRKGPTLMVHLRKS